MVTFQIVIGLVTYLMASNSRLAIAVHTAEIIAFMGDTPASSRMIAKSVGTNPVVIRRIISSLARHGLVNVRLGTGGGSTLAGPPEKISLEDIYLALEEGEIFEVPILDESHACPIGRAVRPVLCDIFETAHSKLIEQLREVTLADLMKTIKKRLPAEMLK